MVLTLVAAAQFELFEDGIGIVLIERGERPEFVERGFPGAGGGSERQGGGENANDLRFGSHGILRASASGVPVGFRRSFGGWAPRVRWACGVGFRERKETGRGAGNGGRRLRREMRRSGGVRPPIPPVVRSVSLRCSGAGGGPRGMDDYLRVVFASSRDVAKRVFSVLST